MIHKRLKHEDYYSIGRSGFSNLILLQLGDETDQVRVVLEPEEALAIAEELIQEVKENMGE